MNEKNTTGSMSKSGGIERVTANLANMWAEDGYCVEIMDFR